MVTKKKYDKWSLKKIKYDKEYIVRSRSYKTDIPVFSLHFQGGAKRYMRIFYETNSLTFPLLLLHNPTYMLKIIVPRSIRGRLRDLLLTMSAR